MRRPSLLLCFFLMSCGGGSSAASTSPDAPRTTPSSGATSTAATSPSPVPSEPLEAEESAPSDTAEASEATWTETPSEGGPRPPFELVAQEIHRMGRFGEQPIIRSTIGPRERLVLVGDERGRWTVYDLGSGWARISRRWTRRMENRWWSQGFDPTGRWVFLAAADACVFGLEHDTGSCLSAMAVGSVGREPIAALAPGGRRLLYVGFEGPRSGDRQAVLRAWVPGEARSRQILSLPGFLPSGELWFDFEGDLTYASQGSRSALTNLHDTWLIDTSSDAVVSRIRDRIACTPPFDPDGRWLALAGDDVLELRDARTGALRHRVATEGTPRAIAWAADGQTLAFCVAEGEARRVNTQTGEITSVEVTGCPDTELRVQGRRVRAVPPRLVIAGEEGYERSLVIHGRRTRAHLFGSGELSLWGVSVAADSAETRRRSVSERWGREGMRAVPARVWAHPTSTPTDVVGTSASGRVRLLRAEDGAVSVGHRRGRTVALRDPVPFRCFAEDGAGDLCTTTLVFSPDDAVLALTAPHQAAVYDAVSGRRLGLMSLGHPETCAPPCASGEECIGGECADSSYSESRARIAFSPSSQRLVVAGNARDTYLFDLEGERLARLAPESSTNFASLHQLHAFSSDSTQLAFVRRQTLQLLNAQDGTRQSRVTLPEPARLLTFSADASTLAVVTVADRLLRVRVADGSVTDVGVLEGLRGLGAPSSLAVICQEGMMYLRRLFTDSMRGPLGRCPPAGSFVVGATGAFVGYHGGTLARIHRVSDGEVLNLRAIDRAGNYDRMRRPTRLLAFSDSGWFDMNSGQPLHLRVRAGASFDAEMASPHESPHRREGLVEAFFSGERLAPAE